MLLIVCGVFCVCENKSSAQRNYKGVTKCKDRTVLHETRNGRGESRPSILVSLYGLRTLSRALFDPLFPSGTSRIRDGCIGILLHLQNLRLMHTHHLGISAPTSCSQSRCRWELESAMCIVHQLPSNPLLSFRSFSLLHLSST